MVGSSAQGPWSVVPPGGPPDAPGHPGSPAPRSAPTVIASLAASAQRVEAGGEAVFELAVRNIGPTPDEISVEVLGEAAGWATVDPPSLRLAPGAAGIVAVRCRPPHGDPPAPDGVLDIGIVVRSAEHPALAAMELATLEVLPPASVGHARGRGRWVAAAGLAVALIAVTAVAVAVSTSGPGPASSPEAVATPAGSVAPVVTPAPSAAPTATAPSPSPIATSPDPGLPVAWWQDAYDAAVSGGVSLGALVADGTTDDNLPYAQFANGAVIQRIEDAHWLSDAIWDAWRALGGGPGPAATIGYPTSGPLGPDLEHRRQLFDDGAIFWTPASGPQVIHGPVWDHWTRLVRDRGGDVADPLDSGLVEPLGYPTSGIRVDAAGAWVELERGRIGVRDDGLAWACSSATPPATFAACAAVDPRP